MYIPQKSTAKPNSLPWFTRKHHRLRRKKQRAYKAKSTKTIADWDRFASIQKELKKALNSLTTALKDNVKQFWSYMK